MNQIDMNSLKTNLINDDKLFKFFCNLLKERKIDYINQIEKINLQNDDFIEFKKDIYKNVFLNENLEAKYKDHKKLSEVLNRYIGLDSNPKKAQLMKERKYVLQKLWPHFVRNAIKLLRHEDPRDLGVLKFDYGVKNLTDYFEEFSKFEELLYGIDEYYRDHTLHVFRVYLLGDYIIREIYPGGYKKLKIFDKPEKIDIKANEKEAIWCLIALCHDLGYPLETIDKLNKKLIKILEYFGTTQFQRVRFSLPFESAILDKFILKILSSKLEKINDKEFYVRVQSKFYAKYANAYEKLSHGMMSCILLMKNLVYFKESDYKLVFRSENNSDSNKRYVNFLDDAKQYIIRREILRAIASHDNQDIYHIDMNTLPFLLIICDEIQEWSRPASKRRIYYEIESNKKEEIIISSFDEKLIEFSIKIDLTNNDIEDYTTKKFRNFIKILRSAVHSNYRTFDFKIIILNFEGFKYTFEYKSPSNFYNDKSDKSVSYDKPLIEKLINGKQDPDYTIEKFFIM